MPATALLAVAALSLALLLLVWAALARPSQVQLRTVANLQRGFELPSGDSVGGSLSDTPTAGGLNAVVRVLSTSGMKARLDRLLARAGRPAAWPIERLLAGKILVALAAGLMGLLYISKAPGPLSVFLGVGATVICFFLPELLLYSRGKERSDAIGLELADTLDQMTIAVEAGLGFESAISRAAKNGTGPLAEELVRTLQDIQVGQSRRQAYEALVARTDVPDLRRFIRAVIQADTFGVSVAGVLRTQAAEMRLKRRQRAEEKAMQIPVKVIFPLILCILPVLFIVLLGPAVLQVMNVLG